MNKRILKKKGLSKIDKEELWKLDYTLARYIYPRLVAFKNMERIGYPTCFETPEEWEEILDKMIWSFEKIAKDNWILDYSNMDNVLKEREKFDEGLMLFGKYFANLWD